jgi:hypothetical protein
MERLFLCRAALLNAQTDEETMSPFRKTTPAKSVMFAVNYDDARTAYLWIDDPRKADSAQAISSIVRVQQEQGTLPEGTIISIKRVR